MRYTIIMCFVIPKKIKSRTGDSAILEDKSSADVGQFPECREGDYVIVTSGIAVSLVSRDEAQSIRSLIKETNEQIS